MNIQQTIVQKTFIVKYGNLLYYVGYVNSDGQTLALLNRNNWEIYTDDNELLDIYLFKNMSKKEKIRIRKNVEIAKKLINFCIKHFGDYNPIW